MSTNDVPGANAKNADLLATGCWAEHDDGSLIFVKSTEAGRVIYEIFDMADDPPTVYTDAMPEDRVPADVVPVPEHKLLKGRVNPRCLACQRFVRRIAATQGFAFCDPSCASRAYARLRAA